MGRYPKEPALENIWIYYPETDKSEQVSGIPEAGCRGGALLQYATTNHSVWKNTHHRGMLWV